MSRRLWAVLLAMGLAAGGCELVAGVEDLQVTGDDGSGATDSTVPNESSTGDASAEGASDATVDRSTSMEASAEDVVVEVGMMALDGPSTLPETGIIEASVPDGCVPTTEDCTNGKDDDCNGLSDCSDPACMAQHYACVPGWPAGWAPVALNDAYSDAGSTPTPPTCASQDPNYPNQAAIGYYAPIATPATCDCGCGSISGVTCSAPTVGCGPNCGQLTTTTLALDGGCTTRASQGGLDGCQVSDPGTPSGGTCGAGTGTPSITAWGGQWEGAGRVCVTNVGFVFSTGVAGGCPAGDSCIQPPANGIVCIADPGETTCPSSGQYIHQRDYNTTATDGRTCAGSCTCSPSLTTATCSPIVTMYSQDGCMAANPSATVTTACHSTSNWGSDFSATATPGVSGGSCAAGGSYALTGSIAPSGTQTTVCCIP